MKKSFSRLATVAVLLLLSVFALSAADMAGKTVILHSNDVHGSIAGYANIAQLRSEYEEMGAEVILVDVGDFSQGTVYVSTSKGADAVTMMNAAGYDVVALGNHEFDYGYAQLRENLDGAEFKVVCSNVFEADGTPIYDPYTIYTTESGLKIGFVGVETPESQTKANPALIKGLIFPAGEEMYAVVQESIDEVTSEGADVVIILAHLGVDSESAPNRSYDLYANTTGFDFIIDGHSHTVMTEGENGEKIQSTGTAFAYIGVVVIDDATQTVEDNYLVPVSHDEDGTTVYDIANDPYVSGFAQEIIDRVNGEYNIVFAQSLVDLNGERDPGNRTEETNLGDLITDSMVWNIIKDEGSLTVSEDYVVAIANGGGIRASIPAGSVTKKDVNTTLPFGNTIAVVYVSGNELLEALEASTYSTPTAIGAFPQVAGIDFTVDTSKPYDSNPETYPASTYYGPASINRVTINSVNGKPFDPDATYAVITNNFLAAGGDTYYAFVAATSQFDTGIPLDEGLMAYITDVLGGVIGEEYAQPAGRIHII